MTTPAPADPTVAPRTRLIRTPNERVFLHVLVNTAAANITTSYLWFALTFWVYLETRSVVATGIIGGTYMLLLAVFSTFNNLIGGVYIALMDPYGLTLFSVEAWGTVFGFAAAFESAAAPITAFLIAPIAEFWVIPYMETPSGQQTWGWLLGDGEARGIALVFVFAGLAMVVSALLAFATRSYRLITEQYRTAPETPSQTESETETERTPAP